MFAGRKGRESSVKKQMISTVIEKMQELIDTTLNISNCVSSSEHSEFGPGYEKGSLSRQNRHIDGGRKKDNFMKSEGSRYPNDILCLASDHLALWIALLPRL